MDPFSAFMFFILLVGICWVTWHNLQNQNYLGFIVGAALGALILGELLMYAFAGV